ncbi:MAG: hypothetical protein VKJ04_08135 [Vampirovibrionales bacterium]|nr:hypothetical protein [Vampirovibrionales bacterium]
MKFDKHKATLFMLKAVSYSINTAIVIAVAAGIGFFVYYLFMGGTAKIKRAPKAQGGVEVRGERVLNAYKPCDVWVISARI